MNQQNNQQNNQQQKQQPNPDCSACPKSNTLQTIISFFWTLVTIFAIYLTFKCNKGFNFGEFLLACCCAPFYVAYKLAVGNCFETMSILS
jgi:hypothetical protein